MTLSLSISMSTATLSHATILCSELMLASVTENADVMLTALFSRTSLYFPPQHGLRRLAKEGRVHGEGGRRLESTTIDLSSCEEFVVLAAATATCAGSFECDISGGKLGVSPGTSITGNFVGDQVSTLESADCAAAGLAAWQQGTALSGTAIPAEMGGVTFTPGVYTTEYAANIAATNPKVHLDAQDDPDAVFIFIVGSAL
jgi:hypothetical protein